jgi:hypothetical protein
LLAPEPFNIVPIILEPSNNGVGIQHVKWLLIVNKTITPVHLIVLCNKRPTSVSAEILGGGPQLSGGNQKLTEYQHEINITSPAWGPKTPMVLDLSYNGDQNMVCQFQER